MDRTARIWDAMTGVPLSDPLWHKGPVRMAQFSPTERVSLRRIVSRQHARIWQVQWSHHESGLWPALAEAVAGLAVEAQGTTRLCRKVILID